MKAVSFTSDGTLLATGGNDDRVRLWRVEDGRPLWSSPPLGRDFEALPAGGDRIAARIYSGETWVWTVTGHGAERSQRLRAGHGWSMAMTPDGRRVAVAGLDGGVVVRDVTGSAPMQGAAPRRGSDLPRPVKRGPAKTPAHP